MRAPAFCACLLVACTSPDEGAVPADPRIVEAPDGAVRFEHLREGHTVVEVPLAAAHDFLPRTGDRVWLALEPPRRSETAIARSLIVVGSDAQSVQLAARHEVARCILEATAAAPPLVLSLMHHDEGPEQCPAAPDTDLIAPEERTTAPRRGR